MAQYCECRGQAFFRFENKGHWGPALLIEPHQRNQNRFTGFLGFAGVLRIRPKKPRSAKKSAKNLF
jgi:hypothetical protein